MADTGDLDYGGPNSTLHSKFMINYYEKMNLSSNRDGGWNKVETKLWPKPGPCRIALG